MKHYSLVCEALKLNEALDAEGIEKNRFKRLWNRIVIGVKSDVRQLLMAFRVYLWPSYLWADAVNICKLLSRIGTRQNENLRIELQGLMRAAGDGKFKTGKEFNNALQVIMQKYNLHKQRLFDHIEQ